MLGFTPNFALHCFLHAMWYTTHKIRSWTMIKGWAILYIYEVFSNLELNVFYKILYYQY